MTKAKAPSSSSPASSAGCSSSLLCDIYKQYQKTTDHRTKLLDGFLVYVLATGIIQFVYCCLVGTFPFNSFLAGFICTVAVFVLTVSLRMQINEQNVTKEFDNRSKERALGDFLFCALLLFLCVMNFLG